MATKLTIFTGRYSDPAIAGSGLVPIGITRYPPRFALPGYKLKAVLLLLAPTAAMLAQAKRGTLTPNAFKIQYERQLEAVGITRILNVLRGLQGSARGIVLLCYEPAGKPCHRRTLAGWLQRKGGLTVDEFNGNIMVQHHIEEEVTVARPVALAYIRRSKASDERTVSLAVQQKAIETYAEAQGWTLAGVVEHDGISGGKRSRFTALDAAVKAHGARVVICHNLDRLARDAAALLDWVASASRLGVSLYVVGRGKMETTTSAGYLGVGVEALVAAHFRLVVGEKTKGALSHLRSQGKRWTRVAPFGSRWSAAGTVEPDPVEHVVVERARALRSTGKSLRQIAVALGPVSRAGTPLSPETINGFLHRLS